MDPTQTLISLVIAIQDLEPGEIDHLAECLNDWLKGGGFEPEKIEVYDKDVVDYLDQLGFARFISNYEN